MSPEAQRTAIATACGWKHVHWNGGNSVPFGDNPKGNQSARACDHLPDYLGDLNAIHAAVMSRDNDERWAIFATLAQIVPADIPSACGTAAQWSEAFLRTLNLWGDPINL